MKAIAISGSLREDSSNTRLLKRLQALSPSSVAISLFQRLADLPHFNPDESDHAFEAVKALRTAIAEADAVVISTPEYAHGLPGTLKNALDWLVGSGELHGKPVMLVHIAARAQHARAQLREILVTMGAILVEAAQADLDVGPMATPGAPADAEAALLRGLAALAAFVEAEARTLRT